jgi:hypothetical protein
VGHEPDSDREHDKQVSQHDEFTSIASKKIVACDSGGVKSKNFERPLKSQISAGLIKNSFPGNQLRPRRLDTLLKNKRFVSGLAFRAAEKLRVWVEQR